MKLKYLVIELVFESDELQYGEVLKMEDNLKASITFEYCKSIVNDLEQVYLGTSKLGLLLMTVGIDTYKYPYLNQYLNYDIKKLYVGELCGNKNLLMVFEEGGIR